LIAAAHALAPLGRVLVVAPREQQTSAGRSMPASQDCAIDRMRKVIEGDNWEVYAVGGSPAQTVQRAVLVLSDRKPDLLVAGINYGENVGNGVTISGTVGAALEAANFGIPALAVSLETEIGYHLSHSEEVDFTTAMHFTRFFAEKLLTVSCPHDVDVLKVDVPGSATIDTEWRVTRQARQNYWIPVNLNEPEDVQVRKEIDYSSLEPDSDIAAISELGVISVTPISMDLTSRVSLKGFEQQLRIHE
ncbi:MAG: 5'/3'-nucleotidase SurE, partial [Anaerolineales bacterium]|nr:5'/3'-nucleotidase SurE [Anaerolineales bacterium]